MESATNNVSRVKHVRVADGNGPDLLFRRVMPSLIEGRLHCPPMPNKRARTFDLQNKPFDAEFREHDVGPADLQVHVGE